MSVDAKPKYSLAQAAKDAATELDLQDLNRLRIALASAAAEQVGHNPVFAARVRMIYNTLAAATTRAKPTTARALAAALMPIKRVEGVVIDPVAPVDPALLLEIYGPHQLPTALDLFSLAQLKEAAARIAERHPGTKPRNRTSKAAVIEYIVEFTARDA